MRTHGGQTVPISKPTLRARCCSGNKLDPYKFPVFVPTAPCFPDLPDGFDLKTLLITSSEDPKIKDALEAFKRC